MHLIRSLLVVCSGALLLQEGSQSSEIIKSMIVQRHVTSATDLQLAIQNTFSIDEVSPKVYTFGRSDKTIRMSTLPTDGQEASTNLQSETDLHYEAEDDVTSLWLFVLQKAELVVLVIGYLANVVTLIALQRSGCYFNPAICLLLKHQSLVDSCVSALATIILLQPFMWRTGVQNMDSLLCGVWHSQAMYWGVVFISVWNLVLVSVERYMAVCQPLSHSKLTTRCMRQTVILLYPASILATLLGYFQVDFDEETGRCINDEYRIPGKLGERVFYAHAIVSFFTFYIIPITCYVIMYSRILYVLKVRTNDKNFVFSNTIRVASDRLTKTAITLTIIFIFSIGFGLWHYVLAYTGVITYEINKPIQQVGVFLSVVNSCVNPFIYASLMPAYRKCLKTFCTMCMQCCKAKGISRSKYGISTDVIESQTVRSRAEIDSLDRIPQVDVIMDRLPVGQHIGSK